MSRHHPAATGSGSCSAHGLDSTMRGRCIGRRGLPAPVCPRQRRFHVGEVFAADGTGLLPPTRMPMGQASGDCERAQPGCMP
jgi:hypothetical protein